MSSWRPKSAKMRRPQDRRAGQPRPRHCSGSADRPGTTHAHVTRYVGAPRAPSRSSIVSALRIKHSHTCQRAQPNTFRLTNLFFSLLLSAYYVREQVPTIVVYDLLVTTLESSKSLVERTTIGGKGTKSQGFGRAGDCG